MPTDPTTESASSSLLSEVAAKYATVDPVRQKVVDILADRGIEARATALEKALTRRSDLQRDLKKAEKPDVEHFNPDGSPAPALYTKAKVEEVKKAREALDKVEKAIDLALTKNDFTKVKEVAKAPAGKDAPKEE